MYYTALYSRSGRLLFDGQFESLKDCLQTANAQNVPLDGLDAQGLDLRDVTLDGASLCGANFSGADLTGANLAEAKLAQADFSNATLVNACLVSADLHLTRFQQADLAATMWEEAVIDRAFFDARNIRFVDYRFLASHKQVRVQLADQRILQTDAEPVVVTGCGDPLLFINGFFVPTNTTYDKCAIGDLSSVLAALACNKSLDAEAQQVDEYPHINTTINNIA